MAAAVFRFPEWQLRLRFRSRECRVRVIGDGNGLNFRINAIPGLPIDGNLGGGPGSIAGTNPDAIIANLGASNPEFGISATAFLQPYGGLDSLASAPRQLSLDAQRNNLVVDTGVSSSGAQSVFAPVTLNGAPLDFGFPAGFDIGSDFTSVGSITGQQTSHVGYAILEVGVTTGLYSIRLDTGAATFLGAMSVPGLNSFTLGKSHRSIRHHRQCHHIGCDH